MNTPVTVKLDTAMLDKLARELGKNTNQIIRAIAFQLEAKIKGNHVPYDTGAMVNSIYTRVQGHDGQPQAQSATLAKNPKVEFDPIPMPDNDHSATIGVGVNYAAFVELGTRKMAARPFFMPVVEWFRSRIMLNPDTWKDLFKP